MTSPDQPLGSTTGLGDFNVFGVLLFKAGPLELGFGPQWTAVHAGVAPEWQIFSGLNTQFPLGH